MELGNGSLHSCQLEYLEAKDIGLSLLTWLSITMGIFNKFVEVDENLKQCILRNNEFFFIMNFSLNFLSNKIVIPLIKLCLYHYA